MSCDWLIIWPSTTYLIDRLPSNSSSFAHELLFYVHQPNGHIGIGKSHAKLHFHVFDNYWRKGSKPYNLFYYKLATFFFFLCNLLSANPWSDHRRKRKMLTKSMRNLYIITFCSLIIDTTPSESTFFFFFFMGMH